MKRVLISALLLVGGMAALEASAANPAHSRSEPQGAWSKGADGHRNGEGGRMAALNLSQSQKDRIAQVRESHQKEMIQSRADLELAQLEFRKLMRADNPNKRELNAQIDRMASIRADMMKSRVDQRLQVRDILTPDQRAKLREGKWDGDSDHETSPRDQDPRRM